MKEIEAYNFCNETIQLKENIEKSFLELGARLVMIRDERLYEPQYDSFYEYTLELKMSKPTISKLMNIYQTFIQRFKIENTMVIEAGGWSVVSELLQIVQDRDDAIKWLGKAGTLNRVDLRKELSELKTGIDPDKCEHGEDYFEVRVCRKCKGREVIYDNVRNK